MVGDKRRCLAGRALRAPLLPVARAVALGASLHGALYRIGLLHARRLPCRVVSVGGLAAGGSGKTPMAAWVARELHRRGHRVAIASRGYRRKRRETVTQVSDGSAIHASLDASGDEPFMLAASAPGVAIWVARDRGRAGLRAIIESGIEVLVLDDGMQHHRLARDLELVCVDARAGFGNGHCLPYGPLREGLPALARADAMIVIDGSLSQDDAALAQRHLGSGVAETARFSATRRIASLRRLGRRERVDPAELAGIEVGLLCALASPDGFRRSIEGLGARVVTKRVFRDHHWYRAGDLRGLEQAAKTWITTAKDAVKLRPEWLGGAQLWVADLELELRESERFGDWLEHSLRELSAG